MPNTPDNPTLPDDWTECKLEMACGIHDNLRKPINSKERNARIEGKKESDLFPYYGATGQVGYIDDYLTDGEYVLIGEDGAPFLDSSKDVSYLINGKTWVNNHAHILKSFFNNKFLLHFLNQFNFHGYVSGTTRLKLTQGSLKKIPVILAPLPEQRAIVAKIEQLFSELDNGIENLKTARAKLDIYRQAVLKKAFEGELTRDWRARQTDLPDAEELLDRIKAERQKHYDTQLAEWKAAVKTWEANGKPGKRPKKPGKLAIFEADSVDKSLILPAEWCEGPLEYVADAVDPQPSHRTPPKVSDGIPYIGIAEIDKTTGKINFERARKVAKTVLEEHIQRYDLHQGDFVIGKIGTIGRPFFIPTERFFALSANVVLVQPLKASANSRFLYYLSLSTQIEKQFKKGATATTQAAFGIKKVRLLRAPLCSLPEQHQIVQEIESRLSVCDKLAETIDTSLKQAESLRQSILKKAFTGQLLTPAERTACRQQPDYRPAAELVGKRLLDKKMGNVRKVGGFQG